MAADDDNQGAPDPWADLLGESAAEKPEETAFDFAALDDAADALAGDGAEAGDGVEAGLTSEAVTDPEPADEPGELLAAGALYESAAGTGDELLAETPSSEAAEPEDADIDSWLSASEGDAAGEAVPPLTVFAPDDTAAEFPTASTIEIGTGLSGVGLEAAAEQEADEIEVVAEAGGEAWDAVDQGETTADEDHAMEHHAADEPGFAIASEDSPDGFAIDAALPAAAAGAAAVAVAGTSSPKRPAKPAKKQGGIGQIIGIVAGGLMAIPIVLGILIGYMWMGGPDTMGLGKSLPTALRFLLPPKSASSKQVALVGGPNLDAASSLDDLAAGPAATGGPAKDGAGADMPAKQPPTDAFAAATADAPSPTEPNPADPAPTTDPTTPPAPPAPAVSDLAAADPLVPAISVPDPLAAISTAPATPPAPAAPPEPPPLDTSDLESSVDQAANAFEAIANATEPTVFERKVLLVDWYKSLAKMAEELVTLENVATETGRPLEDVPEPVVKLHESIAADGPLAAEIGRLGRQWLAFSQRRSDGVVLAVTFDSVRRVGPYWSSKVSLDEFDGGRREMSIISRTEPKAARGDRLVVTGVVFDDGVIWAADCRAVEAAPALGPDF